MNQRAGDPTAGAVEPVADGARPDGGGRLRGKRVLLTGTGRGQGAAAQELFCRHGATVVGCDIAAGTAADTARRLRSAGHDASGSTVDLGDPEAAAAWVAEAAARMGGVDVLYNNAGAPELAPFEEMTLAQWRHTMVNELEQVFTVTSAAWPHLKVNGASVINIASISASQGVRGLGTAAHSAAKAGVLGLTRQLAAEGAEHGIRVNAISPGLVAGPVTTDSPAPTIDRLAGLHLLGRPGEPVEIARCAVFLASDESSFVTGAEFMVDGGFSAGRP